MADKIRGITVEIGGDTSGLNKALKDTNKEINSTKRELKDVEKLLKLDPHNVELLEQKQKLLSDQIANTSGKLEELQKLQAAMDENGIDENSEQYMALRREIIETETNLSNLTKEAEDNASAIEHAGDAADDSSGGIQAAGDAASDTEGGFSAMQVAIGNLISKGLEKLISACADAVTGTFALADNVNTLANNYGIAQEAAYALTQNQELMDYSVGSITRMMKEQYKTLEEGTDAYDDMGIAVRDASGNLLSQEEIWLNTVEALRGIEDPVERAAKGTELLGNKYYDLGGILNSSDDDFAAFRDSILTEDDALRENLDGLQSFKDSMDSLRKTATDIAVGLGKFFGKLSQLRGVLPVIITLVAGLGTAWLVMGGATTIIEGVSAAMTVLNAVMAANPIGIIILAVTALVAAFILLWKNCEGFRNFFVNAWAAIKKTATDVWSKVSSAGQDAIDKIKQAWADIKAWFQEKYDAIKAVFENAKDIGTQLVDDIKQGISDAWSSLTGWFRDIWNRLTGNLDVNVNVNGNGDDPNGGATGVSYVPYSGYMMALHKGEQVLTAGEARDYRNGQSGGSGRVVNLTVNTQDLSEAQVDYLIRRVDLALGGA